MMNPPLTIKSQLLDYLKIQRTTKDIKIKFGNGGHIWTSLAQLENDGLIKKPKIGIWKRE